MVLTEYWADSKAGIAHPAPGSPYLWKGLHSFSYSPFPENILLGCYNHVLTPSTHALSSAYFQLGNCKDRQVYLSLPDL